MGIIQSRFGKASITLVPRPDKETYRPVSVKNMDVKPFNTKYWKLDPTAYLEDYSSWSNEVHPRGTSTAQYSPINKHSIQCQSNEGKNHIIPSLYVEGGTG